MVSVTQCCAAKNYFARPVSVFQGSNKAASSPPIQLGLPTDTFTYSQQHNREAQKTEALLSKTPPSLFFQGKGKTKLSKVTQPQQESALGAVGLALSSLIALVATVAIPAALVVKTSLINPAILKLSSIIIPK